MVDVDKNHEEIKLKEFLDVRLPLEKRIEQFNAAKEMFGAEYRKLYRREVASAIGSRLSLRIPDTGEQRQVVMFGSNNYQGMAGDSRVMEAMKKGVDDYGVGTGGSALLCGTSTMHTALEQNLASFKGTDECILFSSGYAAQQGWMRALLDTDDIVFMDAYSHASFKEGAILSGLKQVPFRHNNMQDLERKLKAFRNRRNTAWIFVEGVYSMHGDAVDLKKVVELARRFDCKVAVDDAHGIGVLGSTGRGIEEHCGVDPADITVSMGTFSKAFGAVGGYVCAPSDYSDYIRYLAKSHMFSASIPASVAAAINEALNILRAEPQRTAELRGKVDYLINGLKGIGIETSTDSAIVPISVPDGMNAREMAIAYDRLGVFINMVAYPAVPLDQQRFRATVTIDHSREDIDKLVSATGLVFADQQPDEALRQVGLG